MESTLHGLVRAALASFVFGFLALMSATGSLAGGGSVRVRTLGWMVEELFVGSLGRTGATVAFLLLGLFAALVAYKWNGLTGDKL